MIIVVKRKMHVEQKGQALLFVVVAMTVALAVGVSVSLRTLSSVSRVATTDTSARALAAAEGGAEKFLSYTLSELDDLTAYCTGNYGTGYSSVPSECQVLFEGVGLDNVDVRAVMIVQSLGAGVPFYDVTVPKTDLVEINMDGYSASSVNVCWKGSTSVLLYSAYGSTSNPLRGVLCPTSGCPSGIGNITGDVTASAGSGDCAGYSNFVAISGLSSINNLLGLRLVSLGASSNVRIDAVGSATLPIQGYLVTAIGELMADGSVQSTRVVKVRRSLPYLPAFIDFSIYAENGISQAPAVPL